MLVLSRKSMESVVVGGPGRLEPTLKVTVLEIKNGRVRLGFEADASVPVHRAEVWDRIPESNGAGGSLKIPRRIWRVNERRKDHSEQGRPTEKSWHGHLVCGALEIQNDSTNNFRRW